MRKRLRKKLLKKQLGYCTVFGAGTWSSSKYALDYPYYLEAVKMRGCDPAGALKKAIAIIEKRKFNHFLSGPLGIPWGVVL